MFAWCVKLRNLMGTGRKNGQNATRTRRPYRFSHRTLKCQIKNAEVSKCLWSSLSVRLPSTRRKPRRLWVRPLIHMILYKFQPLFSVLFESGWTGKNVAQISKPSRDTGRLKSIKVVNKEINRVKYDINWSHSCLAWFADRAHYCTVLMAF